MKKRFLIVNKGKDKYGLTYSNLNSSDLTNIENSTSSLRDVTDVGKETNTILLRKDLVYNYKPGFDEYASSAAFFDNGSSVVIGNFTNYSGIPSNGLVRLNSDGSIDSNFSIQSGFTNLFTYDGLEYLLKDSNDSFWVIGSFDTYQGVTASGIVKLLSNGDIDSSFNSGSGFNTSEKTYGVIASKLSNSIYCFGAFTTYDGISANRIVKLNLDGTIDTSFDYGTGFNNSVLSIVELSDGSIICSGYFTEYKGVASEKLIKIDRYGNKITDFSPGKSFNNTAYLSYYKDYLLAYGNFTHYNGQFIGRMVKIDINTGDRDMSFLPFSGFNNAVYKVLIDDNNIYVSGAFTSYNGSQYNRFIRLNLDGSFDSSFNSGIGFDAFVSNIYFKGKRIFAIGDFTSYDNISFDRIATLNLDGSIYDGTRFEFIDGKAEYNITSLSETKDSEILPKSLIKELIDDSNIIEVTKSEIDILVQRNDLIPGVLYNITNADVNLYGGTSIFLRAINSSKLELSGSGKFYCPKYDVSAESTGYGIWTKQMEGTFSSIVGTFVPNEVVTANNGATATYLAQGFLEWISGNWSGATSISGATATANVSGFVSPNYTIGQVAHWGGKSWTNVNGNIGASIDKYTLNAEWTAIPFNETDYNVYVDEIQYDFGNDMIIYRKDRYNNIVSGSNQVFVEFESPDGYGFGNPIKDFQWGCCQDDFNTDDYFYLGIQGNEVIDSYFETLNTRGKYIWFNKLSQFSYIYYNTLNSGSYILSNTLNSGSNIGNNTLNSGSYILSNTLNSGSRISNNTLSSGSRIESTTLSSNSYILSNTLNSGNIGNNTLSSNSYIENNTLLTNSYMETNSLENNCSILNNTLNTNSRMYNNALTNNSSIISNTFSNRVNNNILNLAYFKFLNIGANIRNCVFSNFNQAENAIDLTGATIVSAFYKKNLFDREDGTPRLQYVNNSDVIVITNVDA